MPAYARQEIADAMREAGFPPSEIARGVAIALAESGGRSDATNRGRAGAPEFSVGPWQLNLNAHGSALSEEEARDLATSTAYAFRLWQTRGWQPWSAYTSGSYRQFLGQLAAGSGMEPDVIVSVKDTEPTPGFEGQRVITLADGTTYTYRFGLDEPPAEIAAVEGTRFDPANFVNLRQVGKGRDAGQAAEWARRNKEQIPSLQLKWIKLPDGRQIAVNFDPRTGTTTPVSDDEGNPVVSGPGGPTETEALAAQRWAAAGLSLARTAQVGKPAPRSPEQGALDIAKTLEALAKGGIGIPAEAERDIAAARKTDVEIRKLQLEMLPKQLRAIQESYQTIQLIHDQLASGAIGLDEANRYYEASQSWLDAALRGTTPAEDERLRVQETTKRAQVGRDILNRRVESGADLAKSMFQDYRMLLSNLTVHPGPFNPLEYARALTEELGGGKAASDLAVALLAASVPGAQGQLAPQRPQPAVGAPPWASGGGGIAEGLLSSLQQEVDPSLVEDYSAILEGQEADLNGS